MRRTGAPAAWLVVLTVLLLTSTTLYGQTTATIQGSVKDETGALIPGASVTAKNVDTGISRTAVSDGAGRYTLTNLAVGTYEVRGELAGFKAAVRSGISLTLGRVAEVDLALHVGEISEQLVVTGEAPLLETQSSKVATLVDQESMRALPLNGRSIDSLAALQPNVTVSLQSGSGNFGGRGALSMSVAGSRPDANSYMLDGTDVNTRFNRGAAGATGIMMGAEAIREFQVVTNNYSAEYGRAMGGIINAITRSGANAVNGSLFEYFRNDRLNQNDFFNAMAGGAKPDFRRNQFGGLLSGPIVRNRTFFVGSYEGLRELYGMTRVSTVPDENFRKGYLPNASGQLVYYGVNPKVAPFLALYPLPNGKLLGNGTGQHTASLNEVANQDYLMGRIDHQFSGSDSLYGRYVIDRGLDENPFGSVVPGFPTRANSKHQFFTVSHSKVFSSNLVSTLQVAFNRTTNTYMGATNEEIPLLNFSGVPGRMAGNLVVGGLSTIGAPSTSPSGDWQNLFQSKWDLNMVKGRHSIRIGVDARKFNTDTQIDFQAMGVFTFSNLQSFMTLGNNNYTGVLPGSTSFRRWRQWLTGGYVQDDFRASEALTVNLGLRYEVISNATEADGKITGLDNPMATSVSTYSRLFKRNPSLKNFAPRFGFAWSPGEQKTAIRGGAGVFYDQLLAKFNEASENNPPYFVGVSIPNATFFPTFDPTKAPPAGTIAARSVNPDLAGSPYLIQYNVNLQRQLGKDTVVSAGYTGSRGGRLAGSTFSNNCAGTPGADGNLYFPANGTCTRKNKSFGQVVWFDAFLTSSYNGLNLMAKHRVRENLTFQASYTWSKAIDVNSAILGTDYTGGGSDGTRITDPDWPNRDKGLARFHVPKVATLYYSYRLPRKLGGWDTGGVLKLAAGSPFTILGGGGYVWNMPGLTASGTQRPDVNPAFSGNPILGGYQQYFDPNAFLPHPNGRYGNVGRNTLLAPGFVSFDMNAAKRFQLGRASLEARFEVFNLFNRVNFFAPQNAVFVDGTTTVRADAGRITQTVGTPRQAQLGLRFSF